MFGKKKKVQQQDPQVQIMNAKIAIRKLQEQTDVQLQRELTTARELKKQGLKSPSNYKRIGIYYFMNLIIRTALERVNDIQGNMGMNEIMESLTGALTAVSQIGKAGGSVNANKLMENIKKLNSGASKSNKELDTVLEGLSGALQPTGSNDNFNFAGVNMIEALINGDQNVSTIPPDAVPITPNTQSQSFTSAVNEQTTAFHSNVNANAPKVDLTAEASNVQNKPFDQEENLKQINDLVNSLTN